MTEEPAVQAPVTLAASLHDIRNRMFQLQACLHGLIQGRGSDTELCDELSGIESRFGALSAQLNGLLQRLQLSGGPVHVRPEQLSVARFLHDAIEAMPEPAIAVSIRVEPDELCGCFDESLLALVVRDALDNACRFARSQVQIRAGSREGGVLISIGDDGDGFGGDPQSLAQTGLGLVIARRVVEAHQASGQTGTIELQSSTELGGAELRIWLP